MANMIRMMAAFGIGIAYLYILNERRKKPVLAPVTISRVSRQKFLEQAVVPLPTQSLPNYLSHFHHN